MADIVAALRWVARLGGIAALILGKYLLDRHLRSQNLFLTGFVMNVTMFLIGIDQLPPACARGTFPYGLNATR